MRRSKPQTNPESALRADVDLQTSNDPIRVAIVGNHEFVTDGLDRLLRDRADMTVVGTMRASPDAGLQCTALGAKVVILSYHLNDAQTADAGRSLCEADSNLHVIFLAYEARDKVVLAAIDAGAGAVLDTSASTAEMVYAISIVAQGETMISTETMGLLLKQRRKTESARGQLTSRETQILGLLADGTSNREMADLLGISYLTVRSHLRNLAGKLAAHNKLEVLVRAQQLDLVGGREAAATWPG